ncbi:tyrosine-type recombinase/integrase [Halalkalibacterium halodurans]|uniref:tyrosine-type recombinase/integrase n=1 Tax=Halalkalibacterium halodurans TaxID=86665 RepID=UPI002E1DA294|nr:tyrosine-type recombinase/integrase [Halalkalibacterium halodurans]MED4174353.1 tyrosine-type recombinase/integrase [Halalkalibacterium halodurans]
MKYCKKAGVEYKGTHGFRHTHAVLLLESGASIKFVSKRLGHKTIKTTADTYLDITEKIEIKTTSVNWWFALRLKAFVAGLGLV